MQSWNDLQPGAFYKLHAAVKISAATAIEPELRAKCHKARPPRAAPHQYEEPAPAGHELDELRAELSTSGHAPATWAGLTGPVEGPIAAELGRYFESLPPGQVEAVMTHLNGYVFWTLKGGFAAGSKLVGFEEFLENLTPKLKTIQAKQRSA